MVSIFSKIPYELEKGHDLVIAVIVESEGSTPRGAGSLMLVGENGQIMGTIGGGAIEKRSELMAMEFLKAKTSGTHEFILNAKDQEKLGMVCGGDAKVYFQFIDAKEEGWFEVARQVTDRAAKHEGGKLLLHLDGSLAEVADADAPVPENCFALEIPVGERVLLFGGGHCAHALVPVLASVGFRPVVFDNRPEFAAKERFPQAEQTILGDFERIGDYLTITPEDYVVAMTTGHTFDYIVQRQVLQGDFAYMGVVGSRSKKAAVNAKLMADGISPEQIARVHTPIGLDIMSVTPEEIAVSIAAEMILERAKNRIERNGSFERSCPM
ncbi:MAG: XdhC family protein [Lachnospiraceae bacterium]|nr:XdhC family protein [Lachnospiraceae bacterium]